MTLHELWNAEFLGNSVGRWTLALLTFLVQKLRGGPYPLQGGRYELSALEDEAPLELPPRASLLKPFTFHKQIRDET